MLFSDAWAALGGARAAADRVRVQHGDAALLPSSLQAMDAMLAAVATSTLAAAVLDAARSGSDVCPVTIDGPHVALATRSERYTQVEGRDRESNLFAPLSRFWPTADGWLRTHANYAWHRDRALAVLGCDDHPASVASAIRAWRGDDLEDALNAAGALGYVVRQREDWNAHPQGRAVGALPLAASLHISGGRSRAVARTGRFAEDVRVLDLTRVIAGPVATRTLAAWGADVLRVDSPRLPEIAHQAVDVLPGKRSALLDFDEPAGRARLDELLIEADVLVLGYRPGALDRYGLAPDVLAERYPHLSVVQLSAWGLIGPWSDRRGFDSLVQCATGIAAAEGNASEPGAMPAQVLDHATGYLAAAAALLSVAGAHGGGPATHWTLSLAQTANWLVRGGLQDRLPERRVRPTDYYVTLGGAQRPVRVIAPPGQVGDIRPSWSATTTYGTDQPTFAR